MSSLREMRENAVIPDDLKASFLSVLKSMLFTENLTATSEILNSDG